MFNAHPDNDPDRANLDRSAMPHARTTLGMMTTLRVPLKICAGGGEVEVSESALSQLPGDAIIRRWKEENGRYDVWLTQDRDSKRQMRELWRTLNHAGGDVVAGITELIAAASTKNDLGKVYSALAALQPFYAELRKIDPATGALFRSHEDFLILPVLSFHQNVDQLFAFHRKILYHFPAVYLLKTAADFEHQRYQDFHEPDMAVLPDGIHQGLNLIKKDFSEIALLPPHASRITNEFGASYARVLQLMWMNLDDYLSRPDCLLRKRSSAPLEDPYGTNVYPALRDAAPGVVNVLRQAYRLYPGEFPEEPRDYIFSRNKTRDQGIDMLRDLQEFNRGLPPTRQISLWEYWSGSQRADVIAFRSLAEEKWHDHPLRAQYVNNYHRMRGVAGDEILIDSRPELMVAAGRLAALSGDPAARDVLERIGLWSLAVQRVEHETQSAAIQDGFTLIRELEVVESIARCERDRLKQLIFTTIKTELENKRS